MSLRTKLLLAGATFGLGAGAATAAARARGPVEPPAAAPPPPPPPDPYLPWVEALLERPEPGPADPCGPVTRALYERLTEDDLAELHERMEGNVAELWATATEELRPRLAVNFSTFYAIPGALEHTGLQPQMPSEEVHSMARGPLGAGGDPAMADLVVDAVTRAGITISDGATVLDFGCSSGRALRPLAAWRPDLDCVGCDPNREAIAWAQEHLAMARFFLSDTHPPLELDDASVDVAYAISIWSHFDAASALTWLAEMHRVIRPGGALLMTTHGLDSVARFTAQGLMNHRSAAEIARAMLTTGHHWYDVFGEDGDWGVKDPGWGNGYLSLEWLTGHATPDWALRLYVPGALDANQDVVVLERRP